MEKFLIKEKNEKATLVTNPATRKNVDLWGAEGWKDVLQLLKEQSNKMGKLSRMLSHPEMDAN